MIVPRVAVGTDIHAFAPGRPCWLAGLHWPGEVGLAGHSDADVVAHAACNALLAAAGLGDLGANYGVAEPEWAGASGIALLTESARRVRAAGFAIGNVSVQVIGDRPKIGPRREEAQRVLSEAVGAPVSLSAATTDGLGFTGRREGLAGVAVALVVPLDPPAAVVPAPDAPPAVAAQGGPPAAAAPDGPSAVAGQGGADGDGAAA